MGVPIHRRSRDPGAKREGEARILRGEEDITPPGFGRIAAQTAKQVILQRVREAEKEAIIREYKQKIGTLINGYIFRIESGVVVLDLERAQGIMPPNEQIPGEDYQLNKQIKVLVSDVREGPRGPEIIVSRARPEFVERLFATEVPEIESGTVKIEAVAREAGRRTKIAASSSSENVDPVGSLVGQKGIRVQAVIKELGEEKIDIIEYNPEPENFIANALSPAKVSNVSINKKKKTATVEVPEDQLSLAIGKEGQNVRLAAKLTGWRIDIRGPRGAVPEEKSEEKSELEELELPKRIINRLQEAGITTKDQLEKLSDKELLEIKGIGPKAIEEISSKLKVQNSKPQLKA